VKRAGQFGRSEVDYQKNYFPQHSVLIRAKLEEICRPDKPLEICNLDEQKPARYLPVAPIGYVTRIGGLSSAFVADKKVLVSLTQIIEMLIGQE
jgi:hypothetical protein